MASSHMYSGVTLSSSSTDWRMPLWRAFVCFCAWNQVPLQTPFHHHLCIPRVQHRQGLGHGTPSMSAIQWLWVASFIFFDLRAPGIVMETSDSRPEQDLILIFSIKPQEMLKTGGISETYSQVFLYSFLSSDSRWLRSVPSNGCARKPSWTHN